MINIVVSLLFGIATLSFDDDLYDISLESFILVIVFSVLDIGVLIIDCFALFLIWVTCKICSFKRLSLKIFGFLPILYKILVNISYISLFPITIYLFLRVYDILPDLTIAFLFYQMLVGVLIIFAEIHDLLKTQTRSQFLFDIRTENENYEIDENEVSQWKEEFRNARSQFKGVQEY